ncbi:MAG: hypothetical protein R2684_15500 [Pyrinomonadaceae bacterium]
MNDALQKEAESLIQLLTDQCEELEQLLSLAREETEAARAGNFARIIDIYDERSMLGERLETFQKQIMSLKAILGSGVPERISNRISEVVSQTITQDNETRTLLLEAKNDATLELAKLKIARRNSQYYMHRKRKGLALSGDY